MGKETQRQCKSCSCGQSGGSISPAEVRLQRPARPDTPRTSTSLIRSQRSRLAGTRSLQGPYLSIKRQEGHGAHPRTLRMACGPPTVSLQRHTLPGEKSDLESWLPGQQRLKVLPRYISQLRKCRERKHLRQAGPPAGTSHWAFFPPHILTKQQPCLSLQSALT